MSSNITLKVRLGPLVSLDVSGKDCNELNEALKGYDKLNSTIDSMCSDLAERVYPEETEKEDSSNNHKDCCKE